MFNPKVEINSAITKAINILEQCYSQFNKPYIYKIEYKPNSKSYWAKIGRNSKKHPGYFLRIGGLFQLIPNEELARIRFQSTIIHELIHTIPGCMNHGNKFKRICSLVNRKYPQYQLQTSTDASIYGINLEEDKPKYKIICECCGKEYLYCRKPKRNITDYLCSVCKSDRLKIININ